MQRRVEIKIYGRVQGVFFRQFALDFAETLGIMGFVKNEPDRTVRIVAEGEEEKLQKLISWSRVGPPGSSVERVDVQWLTPSGEFREFVIK